MLKHVGLRLLQGLLVMLVVYTAIFFGLRSAGDPVSLLMPEDATVAQRQSIRQELGLDQPLAVQYFTVLGGALRGNLGTSFYFKKPAMSLVTERLPATIELVVAAMAIALLLAIPIGVATAVRRGSYVDRLGLLGSLLGISAPPFWVGLLLILLFAVTLRWLPASGRGGIAHLVLPAVSLALYRLALFVRLVRSGVLEVLGADFIRTARAKGLSERVVVYRHALRNALIPVVTLAGLQMGALLTGAIITEQIFAWPGLGQLIVQALTRLDFPVVLSYALVVSALFVLINLVVDALYTYLDPKVRYA